MLLRATLIGLLALVSTGVCAAPYQMPNSESAILEDKTTKRQYQVHVRLPEDYNKDQKYPVVYVTDSWYAFPIVAAAVQIPMLTDKMDKIIVVGISRDLAEDRDQARLRDYTPTSPKDWKPKTGEADKYHRFIQQEVIPYIDRTYSTDTNNRTYVGVSLGGLWGAYVLLTYPDTFTNYVLASPALWFDNEYIFQLEKNYAKNHKDLKATVYLSVGSLEVLSGEGFTLDMVKDLRRFYEVLGGRGYQSLNIKHSVVDSANHEISFPTSSIMGLYWLYEKDRES